MAEICFVKKYYATAARLSEDYLFEVKWDGIRALTAIESRHWRLWGRNGSDYTERYPELAVLFSACRPEP